MKAVRKILVAFDGSPQSNEAAIYAANLARSYDASVVITYVDHPLMYALTEAPGVATPEQLTAVRERVEREIGVTRSGEGSAEAPPVQTLVLRGDPVREILGTAVDGAFDLIVMGTHGRKGVTRALLGSVAENVVRRAPCSVLTVRGDETLDPGART